MIWIDLDTLGPATLAYVVLWVLCVVGLVQGANWWVLTAALSLGTALWIMAVIGYEEEV